MKNKAETKINISTKLYELNVEAISKNIDLLNEICSSDIKTTNNALYKF